eukprot:TRINITY_DN3496_c0_g1_i4.p1 TRINITY_DN3496_c0_g1~~TRINITY_DN3496_c0_g1_i4.p1  ORF type:complete len:328 (-),score=99.37 TRINITY_DN3496_c0_g1_i4:46-936(-)
MLKNLKSKVAVATQMTKEKMGKADMSMETDSTKEMKHNLRTLKHGYKRIHSSSKSYVVESERLALTGSELGDALIELGSGILTTTPLASGLNSLGTQLKAMCAVAQNNSANSNTSLVAPINRLIENDIRVASEIKRRQETARLKYDSSASTLRNFKSSDRTKLQQLEAETESLRQVYEQLTIELTSAVNQVLAQVGSELMAELKAWAAAQARYYAEMSQMWNEVEAQLAPLPSVANITTTSSVPAYTPGPMIPPAVPVVQETTVVETYSLSKNFDNSVSLDGPVTTTTYSTTHPTM